MDKELEDILVKEYLNGATAKELSKKYNYHNSTISRLMKKRGVSRGQKSFKRANIEKLVIEDFKTGEYCKDLAKKYGVEVHVIYNILDEAGLKRQSGYHTKCDVNYFKKIDSPDKAYMLGFITADGGVTKNSLSIEIQEKDKDVLFFFKERINPEATIFPCSYGGKNNLRVSFCSVEICKDLLQYGIVQNKSKIIEKVPIDSIPKNLLCYYFRGLIDGDGCVHKNGGISIYSGSYSFIEDVQKVLCEEAGVKKLGIYQGTSYFITWTAKKDRQKLFDYLYKDKLNETFYYPRKYQRLFNSLYGNTEVNDQIAKG